MDQWKYLIVSRSNRLRNSEMHLDWSLAFQIKYAAVI